MRGYNVFGASRSGKTILVALFLTVGSFYAGSLFGNNEPIYVSQSGPSSLCSNPSLHAVGFLWNLLDLNLVYVSRT